MEKENVGVVVLSFSNIWITFKFANCRSNKIRDEGAAAIWKALENAKNLS